MYRRDPEDDPSQAIRTGNRTTPFPRNSPKSAMSNQAMNIKSSDVANPAAVLNRRYVLGLSLVALLLILNQVIVQPPLLRLLTDAPLINIAGRQRMLSQKLAKSALALETATSGSERLRWRTALEEVLTLFSKSHDDILERENTQRTLSAFEELEPASNRLRAEAGRLIASVDGNESRKSLQGILQAEAEFLPGMDRIVGLYEEEARAHVDRLITVGWTLTSLVLLALGGIGWFILRPTAQIIERQLVELREARDELESRVEERTRELASEVERRSVAEERQRSLVQQFSHVARTNTIGEMATGLAHELNQPLGAIANYTEGCLMALQAPEPPIDEVRNALGKLLATTMRAGAIVKRIRQFVNRNEIVHEKFDPTRLAADIEEFFRDEINRREMTLCLETAPDLPWLWGDPVQIQQVLVNLVRNAIDAAKPQTVSPTIVISVARVESGEVEFAVTDNGEGIPADRLGQVFDAYFSTRDQGMGMGLAISRTILEAHHTRFNVESSPGLRTTFRFSLSTADDKDARADGLHR